MTLPGVAGDVLLCEENGRYVGLQGGSVPGGWHQRTAAVWVNRVLRQKATVSSWLGRWWLGHLAGTPFSVLFGNGASLCREWVLQCAPYSSPSSSYNTFSAGWLYPPKASPVSQYSLFFLLFLGGVGEVGRQRGNFIQAFLPQSNFKKQQSQKRMRRNKQHTILELRHPNRDRQAGRPAPIPRLYDPCSRLSHWSPCLLVSPPWGWLGMW